MIHNSESTAGAVSSIPLFLTVAALLTCFGIAMIYSAGVVNVPDPVTSGAWLRQSVWFALSLVAFLLVSRVPATWLHWSATRAYALSMVLLAATLVIGTGRGTAAGVKSWIDLGFIGFQPSEIAKITTVMCLASLLSKSERNHRSESIRGILLPSVIVCLPLGCVLLQPDLGTALAFVGILFSMLVWARIPVFLLVLAASPALGFILSFNTVVWSIYIVLLVVFMVVRPGTKSVGESLVVVLANFLAGAVSRPLWNSLATYQKNRILVWLDPEVDPRGAGYQVIQSKAAVGSGGLTGRGFTEGPQKALGFLPERHTDFIFGVVGEELGFLGVSLAITAFSLLLLLMVRMASRCRDDFAALTIIGISGAWFTHVFVNVGMTAGLMPITGIPLPFVSYGGTFLLMSWTAVAICWRLAKER